MKQKTDWVPGPDVRVLGTEAPFGALDFQTEGEMAPTPSCYAVTGGDGQNPGVLPPTGGGTAADEQLYLARREFVN
jgi:hypothetical protein